MMRRLLVATLVWALLCSGSGEPGVEGKCAAPPTTTDAKFAPGQIWTYKANPGEESSTLTVYAWRRGKVGATIHVRLDGIHFRNCRGETFADSLPHAPFARAALDASVLRQIGRVSTLPAFEEGHQDWLSHCGGVYNISVAQMVAIDEGSTERVSDVSEVDDDMLGSQEPTSQKRDVGHPAPGTRAVGKMGYPTR